MKDPLRNIAPGEEADAIGWRDAEIERLLGLLGTAHALICQAVASRNNGGMTTTLTHDEMRAWLLRFADSTLAGAAAQPAAALWHCKCGDVQPVGIPCQCGATDNSPGIPEKSPQK